VSQAGVERRRRLLGRRGRRLAVAAAVAIALVLLPASSHPPASRTHGAVQGARARPDPVGRRRIYLGRSVRGAPNQAVELGDLDNERSILVVGVIHGNETAGMPITRRLASARPGRERLLIVVNDLNPDGVAAGTRQNADRVDLNRNFPWRWRPLGSPGYLQYSGPRPLSEPEARAARALILGRRPSITIWFHQPLGLVDESGGSVQVERRFSRLSGLPLRRLTRYPGSAVGWQNHRLPRTTAFVVELPPGRLSCEGVSRYADAVVDLAS
jgi:murein peptide amidase A